MKTSIPYESEPCPRHHRPNDYDHTRLVNRAGEPNLTLSQTYSPCQFQILLLYLVWNADSRYSRKKTKCDGGRPVCSFCARLGQACVYGTDEVTHHSSPSPARSRVPVPVSDAGNSQRLVSISWLFA